MHLPHRWHSGVASSIGSTCVRVRLTINARYSVASYIDRLRHQLKGDLSSCKFILHNNICLVVWPGCIAHCTTRVPISLENTKWLPLSSVQLRYKV